MEISVKVNDGLTVCQNKFTDDGDDSAIDEAATSLTSSATTSSTAQANNCGRELLGFDIHRGGLQITRLDNTICSNHNHEYWASTAHDCEIEEGVAEHRQPRIFTSGDIGPTNVPDPRISQDSSASNWIDALGRRGLVPDECQHMIKYPASKGVGECSLMAWSMSTTVLTLWIPSSTGCGWAFSYPRMTRVTTPRAISACRDGTDR
jgi:hypothetical protein